MVILEWKEFLEKRLPAGDGFSAVTVGVFDGVHLGHKALIERIVKQRALPVIVTFRQNHKTYSSLYPGDISSFRQKIKIFESLGVGVTIAVDLNDTFRQMGGQEFFRLLREYGKMGFLAVGSNFRCGHNRDTDASAIQQLNAREGIRVDIVETLTEEAEPISSSRIRKSILQGRLREAEAMLGRPFSLDMEGADFKAHGNLICHVSALGRVLPPPGCYSVLLHYKDGSSGKAEIQIERGLIRIPVSRELENIEFKSWSISV